MSWFNDVFGFEESDYAETQARFFQEGPFLHTRSQPSVSYRSGILTMPSLAELRKAVSNLVTEPYGRCRFDILEADAYDLHRKSEVKGALIQVASQFNLLEMPCEYTTPEKGLPITSLIILKDLPALWPVLLPQYFVIILSRWGHRLDNPLPASLTRWLIWKRLSALMAYE
ncbi:hypothetical protein [Klebsiella pneumoniae]|uniref:hypothetical protein n=1 Tax=Klebsiella pneumoniae TaxID=573 RepID=UPI0029E7F0F3|nr:hypothetical protein [Klebsiella pneumoniae]